jgi:hypothetical protein
MGFTHTLMSLEALSRAKELSRLIGAEKVLDERVTQITSSLLASPDRPSRIVRNDRTYRELRVVERAPYTTRRLYAKNATVMRRDYPLAYREAVTEVKSERAYHPRLQARIGRASQEWAALRSEGAAAMDDDLRTRFGQRPSGSRALAGILLELRELRSGHAQRVSKAKVDLVEFVIGEELPLRIPGLLDGEITLRVNPISYQVDADLLEQRFPAAATLLTRTAYGPSTRLEFVKWEPTPEDPDDSDDSAFGSEYRARMAGPRR